MSGFNAFVEELFAGLGPVRIRRMFGGAGVYAGETMFALIDDEVIYLKTDEALRAELQAEGSAPWVYSRAPGSGRRPPTGASPKPPSTTPTRPWPGRGRPSLSPRPRRRRRRRGRHPNPPLVPAKAGIQAESHPAERRSPLGSRLSPG